MTEGEKQAAQAIAKAAQERARLADMAGDGQAALLWVQIVALAKQLEVRS